jgi:Bacterial Ig-like domain (group 3)/FG-GAP-like repeat
MNPPVENSSISSAWTRIVRRTWNALPHEVALQIRLCFVVVPLLLAATQASGQHRFPIIPTYPAGKSGVIPIAVADFNHDGHQDVLLFQTAESESTAPSLVLLPGNGHGGFGTPTTVLTDAVSLTQNIAGDFNGDGVPDIANITANNTVQVLLNNGGGTFRKAAASGVLSNEVTRVGAVGDFNGDGHLDLVVADPLNNRNLILLGKADGTFRAPIASKVPQGSNFGVMVAADLEGRGVLDLAMVTSSGSSIQIMRGNGHGGFTQGTLIGTKAVYIDTLITADLEGNGKLNLIASTGINFGDNFCFIGPGVAVLTRGFNGSWSEKDYPTGIDSDSVTAADMNGDGRLDLVLANGFSGSISILLNQGTSASSLFAPALRYTPGPSFPIYVGVADLNEDGRPDIFYSDESKWLYALMNTGGGKLLAASLIDIQLLPIAMSVSDLNHDGIPDLALIGVENCEQGIRNRFISILSAQGRAFATQHTNYSSDVYGIGLGDLNGDGHTDALLAGQTNSDQFTALLNNGQGIFSLASQPFTDAPADYFAVGSYNAGNKADVATLDVSANEMEVLSGKGNGAFGSPVTYRTGSSPAGIVQRDLNGDGHRDIVVANQGDNTIDVFLGRADGSFAQAKSYRVGTAPAYIAFGDFNRDDKVDLAVGGANGVSILLGKGDGTFLAAHTFPVGSGGSVRAMAVADLRGNGEDDVIAVLDDFEPYMYVLSGDGKGSLGKPVRYSGSDNPIGMATGDFNGDGAVDVAVQNFSSTGISIFYNQGGTHIAISASAAKVSPGHSVTFTASVNASIAGTGTPTGVVQFRSGGQLLGSATLHNGRASFSTASLSRGTHSVEALYAGNVDFNPHVSSGVQVIVGP